MGLLLVMDHVILPTNLSFYDIIKNGIKGKDGPLFNLKKAEDGDYEINDVECSVLIDKRVYDKTKHIYPIDKWDHLNMTLINR